MPANTFVTSILSDLYDIAAFVRANRTEVVNTGTENHGGPLVTSGGLIFIAATYDEKLRAFDKNTGKVLWEQLLPAGGFATPITYMINGRQYIAIAAGGTRYKLNPGGSYISFALPATK